MSTTTRQILGANGQTLSIVVIPNAAGTTGDAQLVGLVDVNGTALTPAQDGTDSTDSNATQATAGVGIRGWLSTLVSLFRAGTAKALVSQRAATLAVSQVSVTTTPTQILAANATRNNASFRNSSASTSLYWGTSSGVTTSNGYLLNGGDEFSTYGTSAIWAVSASGTVAVCYAEETQ